MATTREPAHLAALVPGGEPVDSLLRKAQFFTPGTPSEDYRELHRRGGRGAEEFYRERWRQFAGHRLVPSPTPLTADYVLWSQVRPLRQDTYPTARAGLPAWRSFHDRS